MSLHNSNNATLVDEMDHENETQILQVPRLVIVGTILSTIDAIAIVGNTTILVAIYRKKYLQTTTNVFIASLACADLGVAVLVLPVASYLVLFPKQQIMRDYFCHLWFATDIMFCSSSILNLCAIAVDRYWAINFPLSYHTKMTKKIAIFIIAPVWLWTGLISFPFIFYWQKKSDNDNFRRQLTQTTGAQACIMYEDAVNYAVTSIISYFIPAIALVIMYWKIYITASAKAKELRYNSISLTNMVSNKKSRETSSVSPKNGNTDPAKRKLVKEYKAAMVVGAVVGAFILCWTPFFTCNVVRIFCSGCIINPAVTSPVLLWLGYSNSCLNPFIYGITSKKFKQAFYELYCCK